MNHKVRVMDRPLFPYLSVKGWDGDPLEDGEHKLIRVFNAKGVETVVGRGSPKITIEDFAVLKEGTEKWGYLHIQDHIKDIMKEFSLSSEEEVYSMIGDTLRDPYKIGIGRDNHLLYIGKFVFQDGKRLLVVVNPYGSITTTYPEFMRKVAEEVEEYGRWIYG